MSVGTITADLKKLFESVPLYTQDDNLIKPSTLKGTQLHNMGVNPTEDNDGDQNNVEESGETLIGPMTVSGNVKLHNYGANFHKDDDEDILPGMVNPVAEARPLFQPATQQQIANRGEVTFQDRLEEVFDLKFVADDIANQTLSEEQWVMVLKEMGADVPAKFRKFVNLSEEYLTFIIALDEAVSKLKLWRKQ